jgi:cysteine-rich repeat protein
MTRFMPLLTALLFAGGCSVVIDGRILPEGSGAVDCRQELDGTVCGETSDGVRRICVDAVCQLSRCGDGFVDVEGGEDCEDGNEVGGDGCEPSDCTFTCEVDADCDDGVVCSGTETCDVAANVCVEGDPATVNGDACTQDGGEAGVCNAGACVPEGCGDGVLADPEECDDGNTENGDGCESDCTFTCEVDADCDDGDPCTGTESCDVESNVCVQGEEVICDDGDLCTDDRCNPETGECEVFGVNADEDNDGFSSMEALPSCGTDCDDTRMDVYPGAPEVCDGVIDHNCSMGVADEALLTFTWFADCDGDGFAAVGAITRESCEQPADGPTTGCAEGSASTWTTQNPNNVSTRDCADSEPLAFPGAFASTPSSEWPSRPVAGEGGYDYDCDGVETRSNSCVNCLCLVICLPGFPCDPCGRGGNWRDGTVPECGRSEWFELCGDDATCGADEFRTQRCR